MEFLKHKWFVIGLICAICFITKFGISSNVLKADNLGQIDLDLDGGTSGQLTTSLDESGMLAPSVNVPTKQDSIKYVDAWGTDIEYFDRAFLGFWADGIMYYDHNGKKVRDFEEGEEQTLVAKWDDVKCKLKSVEHAGYDFVGFYYDEDFSRAYVGNGVINNPGELVIYRKYKCDGIVLNLHDWDSPSVVRTTRVAFNEYFDVSVPKHSAKIEFKNCDLKSVNCDLEFDGYQSSDGVVYVDSNGTGVKRWNKTDSQELYAKWVARSLSVVPPIETGKVFKGWSLTNDDNVDYESLDGVSFTSDLTLYAVWEPAEYTVTLYPENGEVAISTGVKYGAKYPAVSIPKRTGYQFEGYFTKKNGLGTKVYGSDGKSSTIFEQNGNKNLYAMWTLLKVNKTKYLEIGKGESFSLVTNSKYKKAEYSKKDLKVTGLNTCRVTIKGLTIGKKIIQLRNANGRLTRLTISVKKAPKSIKTIKSLKISVGSGFRIRMALPGGTASLLRRFSSTNKRVAKVSASGYLKAIHSGRCAVTIKLYNNTKTSIKVIVR